MISCEIGQMNSGGQSDGTQRTPTHSVSPADLDFKASSSDETAEKLEGQTTKIKNKTKQQKQTHVDGENELDEHCDCEQN